MNEQTNDATTTTTTEAERMIPDRQVEVFTYDAPHRASTKALLSEALGVTLLDGPLEFTTGMLDVLSDDLATLRDSLEGRVGLEHLGPMLGALTRMSERARVAAEVARRLERGSLEPHDD